MYLKVHSMYHDYLSKCNLFDREQGPIPSYYLTDTRASSNLYYYYCLRLYIRQNRGME